MNACLPKKKGRIEKTMSQKIKAIVIKSTDRKEKDANLLLFSIEQGKVWATLKGVKSPNAKMKLAQNQFCFGEFVLEQTKGGVIVTGFELVESFHEISADVDKYFEGSAILDAICDLDFQDEMERAQVFVLTVKALQAICFDKVRPRYVLCKFLIEIFKIYGFPFFSDRCTVCGNKAFDQLYVNFESGALVCAACKSITSQELPVAAYAALKVLSSTDLAKLSTVKLAQNSEMTLLKVLAKNFEERFDCKLKMIGIF